MNGERKVGLDASLDGERSRRMEDVQEGSVGSCLDGRAEGEE